MKFICAVLSALVLGVFSLVLLSFFLEGYTKLASSNPAQLGEEYFQNGISVVTGSDGKDTRTMKYATIEEATVAAVKDIQAAKNVVANESTIQKIGWILAMIVAALGFAGWFFFYLVAYVTTKPLDTILDSILGNFVRYIATPTSSIVVVGVIVAFIGDWVLLQAFRNG